MRYDDITWGKVAEVYRDDGAWGTVTTALRYGYGMSRLFYLRRLKHQREAVSRVQGNRMVSEVFDPGIGSELIVRGIHEKLSTRVLRRSVKPGMHVIDVGANIGYYTIMEAGLVGPTGRVVAVEPVPRNHELLERNVALNGYADRVQAVQAALGEHNGSATLHLSKFSTRHSFADRPSAETVGEIEVPMITLESLIEKAAIELPRLGLLRMDIEGYEGRVLPGMVDLLKACPGLLMYIEFHQKKIAQLGDSFPECLHALRAGGARFERLHVGGERGKEVLRDVSIDEFLASERLMSMRGMESWLRVGNGRVR